MLSSAVHTTALLQHGTNFATHLLPPKHEINTPIFVEPILNLVDRKFTLFWPLRRWEACRNCARLSYASIHCMHPRVTQALLLNHVASDLKNRTPVYSARQNKQYFPEILAASTGSAHGFSGQGSRRKIGLHKLHEALTCTNSRRTCPACFHLNANMPIQ